MNIDNKVSPIPNNDDMTIEAISVDKEGNIDPISFEYNEYRSELNRIYKMTNEINSIVSTFIIEEEKCHHTMIVKYNNGMTSKEKDFTFAYTEGFKNDFLVPMLEDFCKYNTIKTEEVVNQNKKEVLNITTVDNDVLTINNIDPTFAKQLESIIYKNNVDNEYFDNKNKIVNSDGKSNIGIIVMLLFLIGLLVIGCIFLLVKKG